MSHIRSDQLPEPFARFSPMPSFFQSGRFHGISYITGPSHVCLQIEFASQPTLEPRLVALPPFGNCSHGALDLRCVLSEVIDAASETNRDLGSKFFPSVIRYSPNDSPYYDLFGYCTSLLVRRLASGGSFTAVPCSE